MQTRKKRLESLNLVSFSHLGTDGKADMEGVGRTLDLSEGGILLEVTSRIPSDEDLLDITIGIRQNIIKVTGRIVHQRPLPNGNYALGVSFSNLSPTDRSTINSFLEAEEK